jgi:capsular polysaccharide biosynthesis protein
VSDPGSNAMPGSSVFIFDSSYPSAEVALPIDDSRLHIVVSDRGIEPPPGHQALKLEEQFSVTSFPGNLRQLQVRWREARGAKCIVIAARSVRKEQLLLNLLCALLLSRNVVLFDGVSFKSPLQSWRVILSAAVRIVGKTAFGALKAKFETFRINQKIQSHSLAATLEGRLLGLYTNASTFSVPLDIVVQRPCAGSAYGDYTRGWYLPMVSRGAQVWAVQTTRHKLRDVCLHVEDVNGSPERFLFKDGKILDYPYLLARTRGNAGYLVSTRNEINSLERGIDLLHYTSGYYHWLLEGIPRVLDLLDDGIDFDEYTLIMPPLDTFHRQTLGVLGISPERQVLVVDKGDWCHLSECIFPTAHFPFAVSELEDPSGQPDRMLLRKLRERLLDLIPARDTRATMTPKRLYISRAETKKRKFTSEVEASVRSVLENQGFQTIFLERLSWTEQVSLISGAEFVVGMHGAGLANILFSQAKGIVEFHNPLEVRPHFALMARELNMRYGYIVCSVDGQSSDFDNITVDLAQLADLLNRVTRDS